LVVWLLISFSCDGQRDLTLLEVEVYWGKDSDDSHSGVTGVKGAIRCWDVHVKIALGDSVKGNNGGWDIGSDLNHNFTIGEDVSLREIILEEENNLERTSHANRQFDCSLHGMQLHLSDVACRLIDNYVLRVGLGESSIEAVRFDGERVCAWSNWSD
jgi:hypothetical protein